MKRTITILAVAAALTLSGCSSVAPKDDVAPTIPSTVTTVAATTTAPVSASPMASTAMMDPFDPKKNARGNVIGVFGAVGMAVAANGYTGLAMFVVSSIKPGECMPIEGFAVGISQDYRMLIANMTVQAEADSAGTPVYANSGGGVLTIILKDGSTWDGVPTSAGCVPKADGLPATIPVGQKLEGAVALIVPKDAAALVFKPTLGIGYEYPLPS